MSKVAMVVLCTVLVASVADGSPAFNFDPAKTEMKENCEIKLHNMTHALTEITEKIQPLLVDPKNDPMAVKLRSGIDRTFRLMEDLAKLDGEWKSRVEFKRVMDLCRDLVVENLGTVAWVSFFVEKNEHLVSYQTD